MEVLTRKTEKLEMKKEVNKELQRLHNEVMFKKKRSAPYFTFDYDMQDSVGRGRRDQVDHIEESGLREIQSE